MFLNVSEGSIVVKPALNCTLTHLFFDTLTVNPFGCLWVRGTHPDMLPLPPIHVAPRGCTAPAQLDAAQRVLHGTMHCTARHSWYQLAAGSWRAG